MLQARSLDVKSLSTEQACVVRQLLPECLWPALLGQDPWGVASGLIYMAALYENASLIGLAVASLRLHLHYAELLFIHLNEKYRQLATLDLLLNALQTDLKAQKCQALNFVFSDANPLAGLIKEYVQAHDWDPPRLLTADFHFHSAHFSPLWMHKSFPIPHPLEIVLWAKVEAAQQNKLRASFARGNLPRALSPFAFKEPIERLNSLVLCKHNQIVGWMICHRLQANTIRYTSLYLEDTYRSFAMALLASSIRLQQRSATAYGLACVNMQQIDSSWFHFAKKRLLPLAQYIERHYASSKLL